MTDTQREILRKNLLWWVAELTAGNQPCTATTLAWILKDIAKSLAPEPIAREGR